MKKFLQTEINKRELLQILVAVLLVGFFYLGFLAWQDYQIKKDRQMELALEEKLLEAEQDRLRDLEIENLKKEIDILKNKPPEVKTVTVEAKDKTVEIIKEWGGRVAQVSCTWTYDSGALLARATGSATILKLNNQIRAVTNKHVILYQNKYAPSLCKITLPGVAAYEVVNNFSNNYYVGVDEDFGYIVLPPDAVLNKITSRAANMCSGVNVGDRVLVLGYPSIGSKTSLTATEGIVSGEDGDYYVTSAKVDRGNSGGAAILVKDSCYLGIPSASVVGQIESLARILKASFVTQ